MKVVQHSAWHTRQAQQLAATEYRNFSRLLHRLTPGDWNRATDCPEWNVRQLVAHVVGATEANASVPEMARQLWQARTGSTFAPAFDVDAISAFQVCRRSDLSPAQLVERFDTARRRALRRRFLFASRLGGVPLRVGAPIHETWRLQYLAGTIYTRDLWMHRVDICRATGREVELTAEHDGALVADVVREWLRRHGRPVRLELTGPAGDSYGQGPADRSIDMVLDAVEFCRAVSGRGTPPLDTPVPF